MTIAINSKEILSFGNRIGYVADAAFSGAYPFGGESFNPETLFGIHNADMVIAETADGFKFQFDKANNKLKAFAPAPIIVHEEEHTPDTSTGLITLDYPAAFIQNVAQSGGQNLAMRSTGLTIATMAANQCCLAAQMAKGVRTQLTCGIGTTADQLAGEGAFTGAATNWTLAAGWAYSANTVLKNGDGAGTLAHDNFVPVIGKTYKVCFSVSSWTVGTVTASIGGASGAAVGADGDYTQYITATSTAGLTFTPSSTARFTIDTVTVNIYEVKVSYITQAWKDVWDNLVQDEEVALSSSAAVDLAYPPIAVMYADQTTATATILTLIDEDDTAASNEVAIYFNQATGQVKTSHADQNGKTAKITYVKNPGSGFLAERAFDNETATKTGADPYLNIFAKPILLWGYAGQMPVNGGTTQRLIDNYSTPVAGEACIDWTTGPGRGMPTAIAGTMGGNTAAGSAHTHTFTGTAQKPTLRYEEAHAVSGSTTTLTYLPLYIMAVHVTAGTVSGPFSVIPAGETPLTKQVAVDFTTGALTFLADDEVTAVKVTYLVKRDSGFLSSVTVDETVTASADKVNLAARAGLIQYVWDDTDGVLLSLEQPGTAPSATHFCTVDINDSANTSIDSHADDAGNTLKVTYIPYTQVPPGCFIDDTDINLSSEAYTFDYSHLVIPGFGVNVIGETGAAARSAAIITGDSGTPAADGKAIWNIPLNGLGTDQDTAMTIVSMPWMILDTNQLTPFTPAGTNANESAHTHGATGLTVANAITLAAEGTIVDVKSDVTGTAAGVWGMDSEVPHKQDLEVPDGLDLSAITSVRMLIIGA